MQELLYRPTTYQIASRKVHFIIGLPFGWSVIFPFLHFPAIATCISWTAIFGSRAAQVCRVSRAK